MENICDTDSLAGCWGRYDWRENFFAPGLAILQALTREGATASGAGLTREDALTRCLGETAEIIALAGHRDAGGSFAPYRDGIAAHDDPARARDAARCEAFERLAVAAWWRGEAQAGPVAAGWIVKVGLERLLERTRQGAALKRRTDWWLIAMPKGPPAMICRSTSLLGQDMVLGYGVHRNPVEAAEKALRELLLMELNLMELLAARSFGDGGRLAPVNETIRAYARRAPELFADAAEITPPEDRMPEDQTPDGDWFGAEVRCDPIQPQGPVSVWLCRPAIPVPVFSTATGSPYL